MPRHEKERHTLYFEVLDAVREADGCPLCQLEAKGMQRYFDGVIYEFVNDPGLRAGLARSKGFCQAHAHYLRRMEGAHALGTAILYRDQVGLFLDYLQHIHEPSGHFWYLRKAASWQGPDPCPACRLKQQQRQSYTEVFADSLEESEFREAYEASRGLCVPHFLFALDLAQAPGVRESLIETHRLRFSDLQHELEEFCRKNDYRFREEAFGSEADSWIRAVRMMVGDSSGE